MKWHRPHRKVESRTDSARPPAAIINDVFANLVAEERDEVGRRESSLMFARRRLAEAEAKQLAWQRDWTFDHVLGLRALLMAQIADLDHRTQPPGANLAGMLAFLNTHHPPLLPADSGDAPPDRARESAEPRSVTVGGPPMSELRKPRWPETPVARYVEWLTAGSADGSVRLRQCGQGLGCWEDCCAPREGQAVVDSTGFCRAVRAEPRPTVGGPDRTPRPGRDLARPVADR